MFTFLVYASLKNTPMQARFRAFLNAHAQTNVDGDDLSSVFEDSRPRRLHSTMECFDGMFACPVCQRSLKTAAGMKSHTRTHAIVEWKCAVCGLLMALCHCVPKKPFRCPLCPKTYTKRASVGRHLLTMHGTTAASVKKTIQFSTSPAKPPDTMIVSVPVSVSECGEIVVDRSRGGPWTPVAPKSTKSTADAVAPKSTKSTADAVAPTSTKTIAGSAMSTKSTADSVPLHLPSSDSQLSPTSPAINRSWRCFLCDKMYARKEGLVRHLKQCHATLMSTFRCRHCNTLLHSLESYETHFVMEHLQVTPQQFTCGVCGRQYRTAMKLWIHQRKTHRRMPRGHRRTHRRSYVQSVDILCTHVATKSSLLVSNRRRSPPRRKLTRRYRCRHCSKGFFTSRGVSRHSCKTSLPHDPFQPVLVPQGYKCVLCGRTLSRPDHFRDHVNLHAGIYPYQCDQCGEAFHSYSSQYVHCGVPQGVNSHHTNGCYAKKKVTVSSHSVCASNGGGANNPAEEEACQEEEGDRERLRDGSEESFVCGVDFQPHTACDDHVAQRTSTVTIPTKSGGGERKNQVFHRQESSKLYTTNHSWTKHVHSLPRPLTHMKLRRVSRPSDNDSGLPSEQQQAQAFCKPEDEIRSRVKPVVQQEEGQAEDLLEDTRLSVASRTLVGRVAVLPVCGEIHVEMRKEKEESHTNTILKKHGSWNVIYFKDNPVF